MAMPTQTTTSPLTSHRIRSVSVVGGFLDGLRLDFANGLNCFIGGRGTGKTTVLEFIRYAFDNLPSRDDDPEEWRRIDSLVEQNLSGGRVQVEIETKNGLVYIVSRSWDEEPVVLTADGQPTQLTLKSGSVFRADIFSQNEVERIADRSPSQLVLIDKFQPDAIVEIENELRDVQHELAANASQLLAFEVKQETIREEVATLPDVEEKLKAFTGSGGEESEAVDQAHAAKALRDRERRAIDGIDDSLAEFEERIRSQGGWLQDQVASHLTEDILSGPNGNALSEFARRFGGCGDAIDISLRRIDHQLAEARQHIEQVNAKLSAAHDQQELAFRTLVEKHDAVMEQATERARLERERNVLLARRRTLAELTAQLDDLRRHRASLLERLSELRDQRFAIRQAVVEQINSKVMPTVRVSLEQFGGIGAYKSLLINSLRGAEIKHNVVAEKIATSVPPRALSELVSNGDSQGLMAHAGINAAQAGKVIDSLSDREVLLSLESVDLDDKPRIELKDGETYKDSMSISKGQKCTSILPILLMDSDRPLLVDQPEDNLDNGFIYETVVTRIREVKCERQLIFVTHNPNIPVLGDASRVFVFKSNGSKGWVDKEGSVDECRNHIVTLLEGGEEAFKLRQQRYKY